MKKIYLLLCAAVITTAGFAQYRAGGPTAYTTKNMTLKVNKMENNKAPGDSLFYFDGRGFYLTDANDNTDFALLNQDYDNLTPNQTGWPTEFVFSFYDNDPFEQAYNASSPGAGNFFPNDITPGVDSAWYIGASSWFTPSPGVANNWWNFGPITIPTGTSGNTFNWFDSHNPSYTDSYDVYIVNMTNVVDPAAPDGIVDIISNSLTPDFSKAQISALPNAPDTLWTQHTINVDAFIGQRIFIYFNHTANDGDILKLDEMWVQEGLTTNIEEVSSTTFNVFPNPSTGEFSVNLNNNNENNVNLTVRNVVGKTIISRNVKVAGQQTETISLADYSKGIYFLTIDNKTVKLIVE